MLPYILPFAVYVTLLEFGKLAELDYTVSFTIRTIAAAAALVVFSRKLIFSRPQHIGQALTIGGLVFLLWILPDSLFPSYRSSWLFTNQLLAPGPANNWEVSPTSFLVFRTFGSAFVVAPAEELFWRGWLMRWLIHSRFETVPFGSYRPFAFWTTAFLFAAEHGAYWDLGLMAGILYNLLAVRSKDLGACILSHSLTNLLLSIYIIVTGQWHYWP